VTDLDAALAAVTAEGGKVLMPVSELPVGRIAMVADPQGVPVYLMTPVPPPGQENAKSDVFSPTAEQRVGWNELASPDLEASKAFYARHFGFQFNEKMPMGEMGDYCFIDHDGQRVGAMLPLFEPGRAPRCGGSISAFPPSRPPRPRSRTPAAVMHGPHQVPGDDWIVIATDPQGAEFGIVGALGG
jgi:predicted enzyme related to lactoylglutathione lyase